MVKLSITYDETTVRVAAAAQNGYRVGRVSLARGVVRDGLITQANAFGAALRDAGQAAKLSLARLQPVVVAVPEQRVFSTLVAVPQVPEREREEAVAWQVAQALPSDPSRLAMAYELLSSRTRARLSALAVAVPREVVEGIWNGCQAAGLTPSAIVPQSLGLAQFVYQAPNTPSLVISADDPASVTLIVTKNRTARFSTSLVANHSVGKLRQGVQHAIEFYESKDGRHRPIAEIVILPGTGANRLLNALSQEPVIRPARIVHAHDRLAPDQAYLDDYLANLGLLAAPASLNLLLPEQQAVLAARRLSRWFELSWQLQVGLATVLVVGAGLVVAGRLLESNQRLGIEPLSQAEQVEVGRFENFSNALAATPALEAERTKLSTAYAAIQAAQGPEIQLVSVQSDRETGRITITGQRGSRASLVQFARALQTTFASISIPTSAWAERDGSVFRIEVSS